MSEGPDCTREIVSDEEVIAAERKLLRDQRRIRLPNGEVGEDKAPIGMAFSGGGIRSATVCLGVLQRLSERRKPRSRKEPDPSAKRKSLIEYIDYLSTVSGGGYIGSWFAANRLRAVRNREKQPDANLFVAESDSPFLAHLRRYARYLSPKGGLISADTWTILTVWFRNALLIQLMVFAVVATGMVLTRGWLALVGRVEEWRVYEHNSGGVYMWSFLAGLGIASYFAWRELRLFIDDDDPEMEPGLKRQGREVQPDDIKAAGQKKIQLCVVLPTLFTLFVAALGLWWRSGIERFPPENLPFIWFRFTHSMPPDVGSKFEPPLLLACLAIGLLATMLVWRGDNSSEGQKTPTYVAVFLGVAIANFVMLYVTTAIFLWLRQNAFLPWDWLGVADENRMAAAASYYRVAVHDPAKGLYFGPAAAAVLGPLSICFSYVVIVIIGIGLVGRRMRDKIREWWSRVGAWILIYLVAITATTLITFFGPLLIDVALAKGGEWARAGGLMTWLASLASAVFFGQRGGKSDGSKERLGISLSMATTISLIGLLVGGAWIVRNALTPSGLGAVDPFLMTEEGFDGVRHLAVLGVAAGLAAVLIWKVDLNEFSMNHFYRNRLVRCYLGGSKSFKRRRVHPFTRFDFKDDLALTQFLPSKDHPDADYPGPYPLINTALNTSQGGDLEVQERMAESFLLSPLFCGHQRRRVDEEAAPSNTDARRNTPDDLIGRVQGYRSTLHYMSEGRTDPSSCGMHLGTAMSISGAAASPNSGYHTSPVMAFLLTLFNARLGWWVPNPSKDLWQKTAPGFLGYFKYLLYELFGSATPKSEFVYLSDGGHFENLGIYELVRRRCRFIIAVDAEQDGDYRFHGLGTAIRRCRVDFDTEIEINVDDIRPDPETGLSRRHGAIGTIRYPGDPKNRPSGVLLYMKSSVTGDEGTDIVQYRAAHPEFPHQSTGDQWFSESQFESYRSLGQHMADDLLDPILKPHRLIPCAGEDEIDTLMRTLCEHWSHDPSAPTSTFIDHTRDVDRLFAELAAPDLPPHLASMILPGWNAYLAEAPDGEKESDARRRYAYCERLIQLMENVYLDLDLNAAGDHVDNTGWMQLFEQWVQHPEMQRAWRHSKQVFGKRFQTFWSDLEELARSRSNDG